MDKWSAILICTVVICITIVVVVHSGVPTALIYKGAAGIVFLTGAAAVTAATLLK
jgi:hypothetical protein